MVKTKNSAGKVVAIMLVLALIVSVFAFIMPHKTARVHAAVSVPSHYSGLYSAGGYSTGFTTNLIKSWDDMIADGDIVEDTANSTFKVVNKNLEGDFVASFQNEISNYASAFEGCTKLTKIIVEYVELAIPNLDYTRMFYGCTSAEYIEFSGSGVYIQNDTKTTDMFTGCSGLKSVQLELDTDTIATFKDLGLTYSSIEFSSYDVPTESYKMTDSIPSGIYKFTLSGYVAPTPSVPSTGVVSNTIAIMLVAVSVLTLAVVSKKRRVVAR